ncbi:MAG: class I SAM-dependent methyltransferase [Patescibacteria group bacterium]
MDEYNIVGYYNQESSQYSNKRYDKHIDTYVKFFFNKRRDIVFQILRGITKDKKDLLLLDIACADGIISRSVDKFFPNVFSKIVGTDIAPDMVIQAQKLSGEDKKFSFFVKNECPEVEFDIVLATGYLSAGIFDNEMAFLDRRIKRGGLYICTAASSKSIYAKLKTYNKPYYKDYRTYSQYKKMLEEHFEVLEEYPYGLFIPKLWAFPRLARKIQPIVESIFKNIVPNLFHEKVYLLRKK